MWREQANKGEAGPWGGPPAVTQNIAVSPELAGLLPGVWPGTPSVEGHRSVWLGVWAQRAEGSWLGHPCCLHSGTG